MKTSLDHPTGASKGISPFWNWRLKSCSLLLRIFQACSSPANTWLSTFIVVQNLPPPGLFLCLLRPYKSFTTLTQFLPYIYKGLWPLTVVNHSPWSHLSLSPPQHLHHTAVACKWFTQCWQGTDCIPRGMHHSLAVQLWFRLPRFSSVSFRSPCPPIHQHLLLIFSTASYWPR